jgi:hypothetical protein
MYVRKLPPCVLTFNTIDFMVGEKLREIHVKPFVDYSLYDVSLLGLDFLKRYNIIFEENYVVLEK